MKTAISIPDGIFQRAERLAKRLQVSRSELYRTALREYVDEHAAEDVTERLNEVYEAEESHLEAGLARIQAASVPAEDW